MEMQVRNKLVIGNWKMNGTIQEISKLTKQIKEGLLLESTLAEVILMPPALYIPLVHGLLDQSKIKIGAQNVFPKVNGAYTGEHSGQMLKEYDCAYVLIGHSERRQLFHEDEKFVAEKFHHVKEHGMIPVLCVGETLTDREKGRTEQIISNQLLAIYENNTHCFQNCVVAYEPVWAIGTGKTASPEQAQEVHFFIRQLVAEINRNDANHLPLLYGGSVNEKNASALFSMPDIDGGLVGGASLNYKQFLEIVKCIK